LQVEVIVDQQLLRPVDAPRVIGATRRIREAVGWKPSIPWMQTLSDIWADALERTS
jgi:GDP-D-mannose dehydratase